MPPIVLVLAARQSSMCPLRPERGFDQGLGPDDRTCRLAPDRLPPDGIAGGYVLDELDCIHHGRIAIEVQANAAQAELVRALAASLSIHG